MRHSKQKAYFSQSLTSLHKEVFHNQQCGNQCPSDLLIYISPAQNPFRSQEAYFCLRFFSAKNENVNPSELANYTLFSTDQ